MSTHPLTDRSPSIPVPRAVTSSESVASLGISALLTVLIPLGGLLLLASRGLDVWQPVFALVLTSVLLDIVFVATFGTISTPRRARGALGVTEFWRTTYRWLSPLVPAIVLFRIARHGLHQPAHDVLALLILAVLWLLGPPLVDAVTMYRGHAGPDGASGTRPAGLARRVVYRDTLERSQARLQDLREMLRGSSHPNRGTVTVPAAGIPAAVAPIPELVDGETEPVFAASDPVSDGTSDAATIEESPPVPTDSDGSASGTPDTVADAATLLTLIERLAQTHSTLCRERAESMDRLEQSGDATGLARVRNVFAVPLPGDASIESTHAAVARLAANPGSLTALADIGKRADALLAMVRALECALSESAADQG